MSARGASSDLCRDLPDGGYTCVTCTRSRECERAQPLARARRELEGTANTAEARGREGRGAKNKTYLALGGVGDAADHAVELVAHGLGCDAGGSRLEVLLVASRGAARRGYVGGDTVYSEHRKGGEQRSEPRERGVASASYSNTVSRWSRQLPQQRPGRRRGATHDGGDAALAGLLGGGGLGGEGSHCVRVENG